jgi:hypothetical protein
MFSQFQGNFLGAPNFPNLPELKNTHQKYQLMPKNQLLVPAEGFIMPGPYSFELSEMGQLVVFRTRLAVFSSWAKRVFPGSELFGLLDYCPFSLTKDSLFAILG